MYQVSVKQHFDAAHFLRGYQGKCERVHGHRFEVAVAVDAVAKTQSLATAVCKNAVHKLLFADYIGRKTTAGNVASCFSPDCFDLGQVYRFTIHHLLELEDPSEPFLARLMEFPA